jgi:hypothetical protein
MSQNAIEQSVARLTEAGLVKPGALKGCTAEEIRQIEAKFQLQLPGIYQEFLARMGKAAGHFLVGSDFLFPTPLSLRAEAEALLEQSGLEFELEHGDFVFVGHQGYEFLFFRVGDSPDLPVFLLTEDEEPKKVFSQFSDWLLSCVGDEIEAFKSVRHQAH